MSNQSYWQKRKVQNMWEYMQSAEKTADEISKIYYQSSKYLQGEIKDVFNKYRNKHGLSVKQANDILSKMQDKESIKELLRLIKNIGNENTNELITLLESNAYQSRMDKLARTQRQLNQITKSILNEERRISTNHYKDLANEAYYRSIFDIQQYTGLDFSFHYIDPKLINKVINSKWSGENYSKRIWHNTTKLAQELKKELLANLITGRTDREVADIINNRFASGAIKARRLVRTESCYLTNQMEMEAYKECDIKHYRFIATLDLRTSEICRNLDNKRFLISKQQPGVNCPPMHPWCRSTTICDISDDIYDKMKRRARNIKTGGTEKVGTNITYNEWYEELGKK